MIARDEQDYLPGCLASVAGVVDEIVLVDTGSCDRTMDIARAAGANVVQHAWNDDFAAARNAALEAVSGDWILVLDADERLAPGAGAAITRALYAPNFDCGFLPLYNARHLADSAERVLSSPEARYDEPCAVARLFRRTPDLRWQGCVHETVTTWLQARPSAVRRVEAPIVHYGYTPEVGLPRAKKQRNLALLERYCANEPDDPQPWTYFAWELLTASDPAVAARAASAAESGWQALCATARQLPPSAVRARLPSPVGLASVRALCALNAHDLDKAQDTLTRAEAWGAEHPNLCLLSAVLTERRADEPQLQAADRRAYLERACELYARCIELGRYVYSDWLIDGATSWFAHTGLALCELELDRVASALEHFEAALRTRSNHTPALLGRAEALITLGHAAHALPQLLALLEDADVRRHADGWLLAALACVQLGAHADREVFMQRAAATLATGGGVASWRQRRVLARLAGNEQTTQRPRSAKRARRSKRHKA